MFLADKKRGGWSDDAQVEVEGGDDEGAGARSA